MRRFKANSSLVEFTPSFASVIIDSLSARVKGCQ
jgi:hypothetical protein